ncbi:MAG TPA: DUF4365 domain-containing protein [Roseiarcus sp.]|jgi:hypothetical protein
MRTRGNLITERAGVNYVRSVVEGGGCLLKEINLQHDFGHDATMMLVVDGQVRPREIAFQIKSGASYVSPTTCGLPATAAHIYFWAEHDLITLGVIYDPAEKSAWWIDLQTAAREFRAANPKKGTTFTFAKGLWNQFNDMDLVSILIPTLLGEAPSVPLERLCSWVMADDIQTHDIGVRAIRARYYREAAAWECLIEAFRSRPAERLTVNLPIALAKLLGHDDIGYYSDEIPKDVRAPAIAKVLTFGTDEIAKLLSMLPDSDFERPSLGYSLMPLFGQSAESPRILSAIRDNDAFDPAVRQLAGSLFDWHQRDPNWWGFWRRDAGRRS